MILFVALWSHLLAAALYGALAIFQLRRWNEDRLNRPLVSAFAAMSVWTIFLALLGNLNFLSQLAESARNLAFLAFMHGLLTGADAEPGGRRPVKFVFASVAAVVGLQMVVGGVMAQFAHNPVVFQALASTGQVLGLTVAAGALILVHNLYGLAAPDSRSALRFPMLALAAMWAFDLHLYTVDYFTRGASAELYAARGIVLAGLAPLFAFGLRNADWKIQVSRVATFQSLSVIFILLYLIVMMSAARALEIVGGDWARIGQVGIVFVMTLIALVLLPSGKLRAWLRVTLTKHLFEHRYDYRQEWLRFTSTLGRGGGEAAPLEDRVVKALADIGGSPAGLLLLIDEHRRLVPASRWNWSESVPSAGEGAGDLLHHIEQGGYVVDFAAVRAGALRHGEETVPVPAWLAGLKSAWAAIPLNHEGRLLGLVLLAHPAISRPLDWEDFDLFRTAGIQAASYIAEARGQQALADAHRFEEFNRRFAFILHDVKNLVSQLSLVARNAERHAENPEFRADMIATLQSSVRKMNDLLARLSPAAARDSDPPRPVEIRAIVDSVAAARRGLHPVRAFGTPGLLAMVDPTGLEQALAHLVQNAIEASGPDRPVEIRCFETGGDVAIEIRDRGAGMEPEFVRSRLFQPFVSTKDQGFGIGAYEARALIGAMRGRLEVDSTPGVGTSFTIFLPGVQAGLAANLERKRA